MRKTGNCVPASTTAASILFGLPLLGLGKRHRKLRVRCFQMLVSRVSYQLAVQPRKLRGLWLPALLRAEVAVGQVLSKHNSILFAAQIPAMTRHPAPSLVSTTNCTSPFRVQDDLRCKKYPSQHPRSLVRERCDIFLPDPSAFSALSYALCCLPFLLMLSSFTLSSLVGLCPFCPCAFLSPIPSPHCVSCSTLLLPGQLYYYDPCCLLCSCSVHRRRMLST